ncbi:diphthine--ammonia ligase, partial [Candidatus Micrarchaeota archaeon]|nr:diphthine--ammonia ligase [Candidatus Micrarchaeota archaeon]MBU1931023.1 diphthine--ammonia ligase [Candidatus Micrarchaeota archaeon]
QTKTPHAFQVSFGLDYVNKDCFSYVLKAFETDLYRENIVAMQNKVELRIPYYDPKFVSFALNILAKEKIKEKTNKKPLRELGLKWGLPLEFTEQPKKAAQYGSNADKLITKIAKKNGFKTKGLFLESFLKKPKQRLGALISGGKDGWYAAFIQQQKNYSIECLISMKSKNKYSFMFHTPNIHLVKVQSKASQIPLILGSTPGKKELELKELKKTIQKAKQKFNLDGIVNGALLSNYQRERIEKVCDSLGLKIYSPLWQKEQLQELEELLQNKFEIIFSSIAAQGLSKEWLGKTINKKTISELKKLQEQLGFNAAGEGGEFETLVLDCPMFKQKITVKKAKPKTSYVDNKVN